MARVIIGSLVAHAALLAVLDAFVDGAPPRAVKAPPRVELVEPEKPPIDVVFLQPETPAAAAPTPAPVAHTRARVAISTTATPSSVEVPPSVGSAEPVSEEAPVGPAGSIRMRPGWRGGPDLTVHEDVPHEAVAIAETPKSDKKLQQKGTEYVVPDLVTTMHVSRDGRASFHDKPDIDPHITIPDPSLKDLGDHLQGWYRDPYAQKKARKYQDMPRHEQAVPGGWDAGAGGDANIDGTIKAPEQMPKLTDGALPLIGGKLDITSWLHRKFIGDPYASRKRVLLDGTRDERARVRENYTREQMGDSAVIMRRNVERVFTELQDPAQRREALFALWDECAEGDGEAGQAGQRARAIVIGAIRGRLSGRPDRFSDEEIAALDAKRTSVQHFVPYD